MITGIIGRQERDYRKEWQDMKFYPKGDGYSWEEFLEDQKGKRGLFMLTLHGKPGRSEIMFRPREHTFLGVFSARTDGKLGTLCVGHGSGDFGGKYSDILYVDGLDPDFMHTLKSVDVGDMMKVKYKVVKIELGGEYELEWKFVRPLLESEDTWKSKYEALRAVKLRDYLCQLLNVYRSEALLALYHEVEAKLKLFHDQLVEENKKTREKISELEDAVRASEMLLPQFLHQPLF